MTGRELIMYILQNGLEDEPIIIDNKLVGFMTINEAAIKFKVTPCTIQLWIYNEWIPYVKIGELIFIPVNAKLINNEITHL